MSVGDMRAAVHLLSAFDSQRIGFGLPDNGRDNLDLFLRKPSPTELTIGCHGQVRAVLVNCPPNSARRPRHVDCREGQAGCVARAVNVARL